jgi:glycosyltransferase involved in cell wall biosynthesis
MQTVTVSVVIPSYNSARFIAQAIDSVLGQTAVPSQVIVVDDGSTDDTPACVARYGSQIEYVRQVNSGASAARNRGIAQSREPLIAFLDADDVWHPRKIETQVGVLTRRPEIGMLATASFDWPARRMPQVGVGRMDRPRIVCWDALVQRTSILTSSVVVRREIAARVGEFSCTLHGPEDRDWFLRVAEIATVATLDSPLTGYRNVPGSLSRQAAVCERGLLEILAHLDQRDVWKGRPVALRRKAYANCRYLCAINYAESGQYVDSMVRLVQSLAAYPLPLRYHGDHVRFSRARSLCVQMLRWLGLRAPVAAPLAILACDGSDAPAAPLTAESRRAILSR